MRARKTLPNFGYDEKQIDHICEMIMATQLPQNPKDLLGKIVCDSDLGHLGSIRCNLRAEGLRLELSLIHNKEISLVKWNEGNIKFYENHTYFTESAKRLFNEAKKKKYQND